MAKDFNHPRVIESYDQHIRKLIPGYELIHTQVHAILQHQLPKQAEVLVVGCGTGYELEYLARNFPHWKFCAIDPAPNMLQQAKQRLEQLQLKDNIRFVEGDTQVLSSLGMSFDAALAILVAHFVPVTQKLDFLKDIASCLKPKAICLSYDLMRLQSEDEKQIVKITAQLTGLTPQQADNMLLRLEDDFHLVDLDEMLQLYRQAGFNQVKQYSQMLSYVGIYAQR